MFHLLPVVCAALLTGNSLSGFAEVCPTPSGAATTTAPTDRSRILPDRREKIQAALASKNYDVVAFGDSIMLGWGVTRLENDFGTSVLNDGFGQDGTEHVLWRLQTTDWHSQSPRQVLILVGTNDLGNSTCDIYWGIRSVVAEVHRLFPRARVVVTGILPRGTNLLEQDAKIRATNRQLEAASASGDFTFFDPHDAFQCHNATPCALFQPDHNLHLTREGYDLLDRELKEFLARVP